MQTPLKMKQEVSSWDLVWLIRVGLAFPFALTACAGSAPSDLFATPLTTAGQQPPEQEIDAGAIDSGGPTSNPPSVTSDADAGIAPEAPDSGLTLAQGLPDAAVTSA